MESFVPLLASLGMSLNMPLSRVICVTHYTGFPFGSASFTELVCWYDTVLSALPQFTCRNSVALCIVLYCIVSINLYSASCSAHQSESLPVRETQREESSLERTKRRTWHTN